MYTGAWVRARLIDYSTVPTYAAFNFGVRLSPEGGDGRIAYQSLILDSFLDCAHPKEVTNRIVCDDRFSIICNVLCQSPALVLHANNGRFPDASMSSMHIT